MKESRNLKKTIERSLSITVSILLLINLLSVLVLVCVSTQVNSVFATTEKVIQVEITDDKPKQVTKQREINTDEDKQVKVKSIEEPDNYIELNEDEKYQLACLIYLESRGEPIECQYGVGSVVINRFTTGDYNSILDVIYEEDQFSPASFIDSTTPDEIQINIVEDLCKDGPTMPEYVTYFRADYYHPWEGHTEYQQIGQTYFSYDNNLYEEVTYR